MTRVESVGEPGSRGRPSGKMLTPHLDGFAVGLSGKIKDGKNFLLLWQGHRQIKEWVKSDGDL